MASVSFKLRDKNALSKTAIICSVFYDGNRIAFSTRENINPKFWSVNKGRVLPSYDGDASVLNKTLEEISSQCKAIYNNFKNIQKRVPSTNELKTLIERELFPEGDSNTIPFEFFEYFRYFIEQQKKIVNPKTKRPISYPTIRKYENAIIKLKEFEKEKNKHITFDSIDLDFYNDYVAFLESKNLSVNSIGDQIKILKTVMHDALSNGRNKNIVFKNKKFSKLTEETTQVYLNETELKELESLDLSKNKRLENTRDLLLLLCWTGQRYQSLKEILNPKNREGDFLSITQSKGNKKIQIPILPPVRKILDKNQTKVIANAKMNEYLKEVCMMVPSLHELVENETSKGGTKRMVKTEKYKLVCTHTGRRSFCTNFYKSGRFPINDIMAISGHEKESTFLLYIREERKDSAKRFLDTYNQGLKSQLKVVS